MIWPFKRKPKVIDKRGDPNWRAGDMAVCVNGDWHQPEPFDPAEGDVLRVVRVRDAVSGNGIRAFYLTFGAIKGRNYQSTAFRKLVERDVPEVMERIATLKSPAHQNVGTG